MNIKEWKLLTSEEREYLPRNLDTFNPYSNEAYDLVRSLGKELAAEVQSDTGKVGVLNRFGELIIHLHVPEGQLRHFKDNAVTNYYGFQVFYSGVTKWFEH